MSATSTTEATPLPTQTEGTTESAAAAGISLAAVMVGIVLLTVVVAWLVSRSRRRAPAAAHPDRPFANP
jgi:hypothetical protein